MFVAELLISLLDLLFLGLFFSRVLLQFFLDRLLVIFKLLPLCSLSTYLLVNHLSLVIVCVLHYLILFLCGLFVELLICLLPPTILHLLPKQFQVFIHFVAKSADPSIIILHFDSHLWLLSKLRFIYFSCIWRQLFPFILTFDLEAYFAVRQGLFLDGGIQWIISNCCCWNPLSQYWGWIAHNKSWLLATLNRHWCRLQLGFTTRLVVVIVDHSSLLFIFILDNVAVL